MHGLEIVLGISEVMSEIPHLVYVGLLSGAKLPIHVPIEYSPQAIDIYRLYCLCLHIYVFLITFTSLLFS